MAKRTKKAPTKAQIEARAVEIQTESGLGFVRSLIRARREFGLVSANVGKERTPASA